VWLTLFFFVACLVWFDAMQERTLAEAENRPAPPQCCSGDVRSLKFSDFKHAHEQVKMLRSLALFCLVISAPEFNGLVFRFVRVYHRIQKI
jgi:hypothetical protein